MNSNANQRISKQQLREIAGQLIERDEAILNTLRDFRYHTSGQLQRCYFTDSASGPAATRAANRNLRRLENLGLVTTLKRRIGGVRAGSAAYVWTLTPTGHRLLELTSGSSKHCRKRHHESSYVFLQHTLAIAEVSICLAELTAKHRLAINELQVEPACWRQFVGTSGVTATLRPDLFAITSNRHYEDHWFIEVDLDTESPAVVVRKCEQYVAYYHSGTEQEASGVFPKVVWLVPDGKRQATLTAHIARQLKDCQQLFVVITMDELESLLVKGEVA